VTLHGSGNPKICSYSARSRIVGSSLFAQEAGTVPLPSDRLPSTFSSFYPHEILKSLEEQQSDFENFFIDGDLLAVFPYPGRLDLAVGGPNL
jgi:hypothetical protein